MRPALLELKSKLGPLRRNLVSAASQSKLLSSTAAASTPGRNFKPCTATRAFSSSRARQANLGDYDYAIVGNSLQAHQLLSIVDQKTKRLPEQKRPKIIHVKPKTEIHPRIATADSGYQHKDVFQHGDNAALSIEELQASLKAAETINEGALAGRLSHTDGDKLEFEIKLPDSHGSHARSSITDADIRWSLHDGHNNMSAKNVLMARHEPTLDRAQFKLNNTAIDADESLSDYGVTTISSALRTGIDLSPSLLSSTVVLYGHDERTRWLYNHLCESGLSPIWINDSAMDWDSILLRKPQAEERKRLIRDRIYRIDLNPTSNACLHLANNGGSTLEAQWLFAEVDDAATLRTQIEQQNLTAFPVYADGDSIGRYRLQRNADLKQRYDSFQLFGPSAASLIGAERASVERLANSEKSMTNPAASAKNLSQLFRASRYDLHRIDFKHATHHERLYYLQFQLSPALAQQGMRREPMQATLHELHAALNQALAKGASWPESGVAITQKLLSAAGIENLATKEQLHDLLIGNGLSKKTLTKAELPVFHLTQ